jgi:hypothetical protein
MRKLVHVKKGLAKHVDKQIQVIHHLVTHLGFCEIQIIKHSFILHASQHLEHGNIINLTYFKMLQKRIKMI